MHSGLYRYTEDALRDYEGDCQRMRLLEEYLAATSPSVEPVQGGEFVAEQDQVLDRRERSEEYQALYHKVEAVRRFLGTLNAIEAAFVRARYFERKPWKSVAMEMHISEPAARCRWGPKVIYRAAKMLFGYQVRV